MDVRGRRTEDGRGWRTVSSRIALLLLNRVVTVLLPPLFVYVIFYIGSAHDFVAVAVGQSLGAVGMVIIDFGWSISGSAAVARMPGVELRANLYARSLGARLWLAIPALVTTCAGAAWLSPSPLTLLQAVVGASAGFSAAWYFIGVSEPRALMLYETVPRAAAAVCAVIVAFAFHSVMALLLVQLAGAIGAAALVSQKILRYGSLAKGTLRLKSAYRAVRSGLHAAATSAITSLYVALPVTILAAVDTQAVPNFSAAQRLEWLALALVRPIREYLQGSVPDEDSRVLTKNVWLAARVATICSLALGAVLTVAAAPLTTALTGGAVHLSFWETF